MKQKKALIVANTGRFITLFERNNIKQLQSMGYQVHCFSNFHEEGHEEIGKLYEGGALVIHDVAFSRTPYSLENIQIYKQLKGLMARERFDLVHCHTPMGGVLARLAAKRTGTAPVLYTAHGFHFYKGAPLVNWLVYYPVEKWLSRCTDVLITINREDYARATKKMRARRVAYIPGVGVDVAEIEAIQIDRAVKRRELSLPEDAFVLLSVGELNNNKNHETILRVLSKLHDKKMYYCICGIGPLEAQLKTLCQELEISNRVHFFGFRTDVTDILKASDLFVFPSKREGLSVALMEAMAAGVPCVASDIRGNGDVLVHGENGFLHAPDDVDGFAQSIHALRADSALRAKFVAASREKIQGFDKNAASQGMGRLYAHVTGVKPPHEAAPDQGE